MDANHKMQLTRGQGEIEKMHYWSMRRMRAMEEYVHRLAADFMAVSTLYRFITAMTKVGGKIFLECWIKQRQKYKIYELLRDKKRN